jgi:hypothetical protein
VLSGRHRQLKCKKHGQNFTSFMTLISYLKFLIIPKRCFKQSKQLRGFRKRTRKYIQILLPMYILTFDSHSESQKSHLLFLLFFHIIFANSDRMVLDNVDQNLF